MKRKNLLLLTSLLLTQTAPSWGMEAMDSDDEFVGDNGFYGQAHQGTRRNRAHNQYLFKLKGDIIRSEDGNFRGKFKIKLQGDTLEYPELKLQNTHLIGFETSLHPSIDVLDPSKALPSDLGFAFEKVSALVEYDGCIQKIVVALPTKYPLHGQWIFEEDRDNIQNLATLKLSVLRNQQWIKVYQHQVGIDHIKLTTNPEPELSGRYYFDGNTVYQGRTRLCYYENPQNQQRYSRNIAVRDGEIPSHKGNTVIYVEPFSVGNESPKPKDAYCGSYSFAWDLADSKKLPRREAENLLYSDGHDFYLPHVTQELWEQGNAQVGFFVASFNQDRKIKFIDQSRIQNGPLSEGLYQLLSVQENPNGRIEKWRKLGETHLGEDQNDIKITVPAGVASIPGIGACIPRKLPNSNASAEILAMQKAIQIINQIMEENATRYQNIRDFVILLGPSESGKSTLIQGLAGNLNAKKNEMGDLRLHADQPLQGFNIGHSFASETKIPGFWHDKENNRMVIDCQGFGDSAGAAANIVNAFSINKLFPNASVKVVLVAEESSITGHKAHDFLKLLNQMTTLYEDDAQLQQGLSIVLTRGSKTDPYIRIKALSSFLSTNESIITPPARRLFAFLARGENRNRFFSFPAPKEEGPYSFNRRGLLNCINSTHYVDSPKVNISVNAEDKELVGGLAQGLNEYLINFIKTEGSQRIINYCRNKIDKHLTTLENLRAQFTTWVRQLRQIAIGTPEAFVNGLTITFGNDVDINDIKNTVETIGFLKKIKNDITYHVGEWKTALTDTIAKVEALIAIPQVEYDAADKVLSLKGSMIGMHDIKVALQFHPESAKVDVFCSSTIFIDQDMKSHGTSMNLLAPHWKIVGARKIDLSGTKGKDGDHGTNGTYAGASGGDGKPGEHGGNGGHFYGNGFAFDSLTQLAINTNGGKGANGGNGGNGANGANGTDASLDEAERIAKERFLDGSSISYHIDETQDNSNIYSYELQGESGSSGGNAGKRGKKGKGGAYGECTIVGGTLNANLQSCQDGIDGKVGKVGTEANHGKNAQIIMAADICSCCRESATPESLYSALLKTKISRYHQNRGSTYPGYQPQPHKLNDTGQQSQVAQTGFNAAPIIQAYKIYYEQQATNPNISPFMKVFPNL